MVVQEERRAPFISFHVMSCIAYRNEFRKVCSQRAPHDEMGFSGWMGFFSDERVLDTYGSLWRRTVCTFEPVSLYDL
jgi:hypothetical protein